VVHTTIGFSAPSMARDLSRYASVVKAANIKAE
jgi:hypothetical protein